MSSLLLLLAGCGGEESQAPPPTPVDLLSQANAASEIVDAALVERHTRALLAGKGEVRYLAQELRRIGLVPGGAKGSWEQRFEDRRRVARPLGAWVLQRGEARASLGRRDFVPALGGRYARVRLRGLPAVFVAPTLAAPPGALASKVVVVLDPTGTAMAAGAASPLPDLFRRAAAARAHAVLVLPRPGLGLALPSPARAAELAANTGLPAAVWLDQVAADALAKIGIAAPAAWLPRLEWRSDLLPLALGTFHAEVAVEVERNPHRNVVAVLPGRGEGDEVVAVVATLPGARAPAAAARDAADAQRRAVASATAGARAARGAMRPVAGAPVPLPPPDDPRTRAAAAAELLAVATAFQALSDPPRRTVVFALTAPGDDGLAGARQLLADPRWPAQRVAGALVLAAGNLGAPTQDLTFVGAQASPLHGMTKRVAAMQGRRVGGDPQPWRGLLWRSPAWAFLRAGVPAVLLEPGVTPRPPAPTPGPMLAAAMVAPAPASAPAPFAGMVEDARLAFRVALELAEGGRPPRVDPARVESVLRQQTAPAQPVATLAARPRVLGQGPSVAGAQATAAAPGAPPTAAGGGPDAAAAGPAAPSGERNDEDADDAPAPEMSNAPSFIAPPAGAAPPPEPPRPTAPPRSTAPPPPAPPATPPQR